MKSEPNSKSSDKRSEKPDHNLRSYNTYPTSGRAPVISSTRCGILRIINRGSTIHVRTNIEATESVWHTPNTMPRKYRGSSVSYEICVAEGRMEVVLGPGFVRQRENVSTQQVVRKVCKIVRDWHLSLDERLLCGKLMISWFYSISPGGGTTDGAKFFYRFISKTPSSDKDAEEYRAESRQLRQKFKEQRARCWQEAVDFRAKIGKLSYLLEEMDESFSTETV